MTSVVERVPGTRHTPGSPQHLPENGYSSSSSSSSVRHPSATPPISPEKVSHRPPCRPQISVEQADFDAALATTSGPNFHSTKQTSHSGPLTVTGKNGQMPSFPNYSHPLSTNSGSPITHRNGNGVHPASNVGHLQVNHKVVKSSTLPTDMTGFGDGLQSGRSSVCNSSDAEYDSDESSAHDPRELLLNENYWQDKRSEVSLLAQCYHKVSGEVSLPRKVGRQRRVDSALERGGEEDDGEYASEGSGDEDSGSTAPSFLPHDGTGHDDDVFRPDFCGGLDVCYEADTKLVDWSYNVFVPACRTLLYHCRDGGTTELSSSQILVDLRSLSNTISFFCTEQQRLSGQLRGGGGSGGGGGNGRVGHGISASISTDRISRIRDLAKMSNVQRTDDAIGVGGGTGCSKTASMSSDSASSSGFESQDGSYDRSYSVKILRSVSQSLIAPLIQEYESGFTPELYKSIVQAIQKIAWKVEACLAINDPSKVAEVYSQIFDSEQQENLVEKMINALPPEEPKLVTADPGRTSRSGSMSSALRQRASSGRASLGAELDQTISSLEASKLPLSVVQLRQVPGDRNSMDMRDFTVSGSSDATCVSSFLDSVGSTTTSTDNRHSDLSTLTDIFGEVSGVADFSSVRRDRIATFASPSRNNKAWSSFDEQQRNAKCRLSSDQLECSIEEPHYFRPKHVRRTTISLSRKEVSKLGWKVARRAEKLTTKASQSGGATASGGPGEVPTPRAKRMNKGGNSSLSALRREPRMDSATTSSITKSASLSDLLDSPSNKSDRPVKDVTAVLLRRKPRNRSHDGDIHHGGEKEDKFSGATLKQQTSTDSTTVTKHLAKSYMPISKQTSLPGKSTSIDEDWTLISPDPSASLDSGKRLRTASRSSKILLGGAAKTLTRKAKKAVVQKSLSASEKFTSRVIKTANALRRGSMSTFSKGKKDETIVVSTAASMEDLQEEGGALMGRPPRPCSTSEPPSPLGTKKKSGTMPSKRSTLLRISKKTKSFGSSASLPRRKKSAQQRTGFVSAAQIAPADQAALMESIYHFSKNAVQPTMEDSKQ